jgi:AcrR family transcriptional regulator
MPRLAGQIDIAKTHAIVAAASDAIYERGLNVSVDEIARRAGVSKQTIYNHYGSKADLVRALIEQRVELITAPLDVPGALEHPQEALTAYARALLRAVTDPRGIALFRLIIASAGTEPDLARSVFTAGARASRLKLADFLAQEARAGRLAIEDADEAADFFAGMVVSHRQLVGLLGLPDDATEARRDRLAAEAARRFLRAYAP